MAVGWGEQQAGDLMKEGWGDKLVMMALSRLFRVVWMLTCLLCVIVFVVVVDGSVIVCLVCVFVCIYISWPSLL